jgi:hypothetical protein
MAGGEVGSVHAGLEELEALLRLCAGDEVKRAVLEDEIRKLRERMNGGATRGAS